MSSLFFFNDTSTTEIYTLSLHDALPIYKARTGAIYFIANENDLRYGLKQPWTSIGLDASELSLDGPLFEPYSQDRKSTRLNSSHVSISYAVFCLKKKKKKYIPNNLNL